MIITLTGPNSFMLLQELKSLQNDFISKHGDLAYEKLDGEEVGFERLQEVITSLPFLASKKLVVLRNPSSQKQFVENIENLLNAIPDTTDLVIVESKLDRRSSYFKVLKTKTDFHDYQNLDSRELSNWIVQYVKKASGSIQPSDAMYLVERVGNNQQLLANEADKLLSFNHQITKRTIGELTEASPQSTIFELLDAAFAGDGKRTMRLYNEQRALRVEPQQIMAMIAWQLHVLALTKTAGERSPEQIATEAKLNPYVVRKTLGVARDLSLADVKKLIARALKLDMRMKSENIDTDEALRHFLLTLVKQS